MSESPKRVRKPEGINTTKPGEQSRAYAGFDETGDCAVYMGGRCYEDTAQIHLSEDEVHALAIWLTKASAYLKAKRRRS